MGSMVRQTRLGSQSLPIRNRGRQTRYSVSLSLTSSYLLNADNDLVFGRRAILLASNKWYHLEV